MLILYQRTLSNTELLTGELLGYINVILYDLQVIDTSYCITYRAEMAILYYIYMNNIQNPYKTSLGDRDKSED